MRYFALATDYDGTIAHNCTVDAPTLAALKQLQATGRRLILVTGRELPSLFEAFPRPELFDWIVAENGALLYQPSTKVKTPLADPPPPEFVQRLRERGVDPISVGEVIVATWEPHQQVVLDTILELGLELQVIFNKGAVMVLPAGVTKATGLAAALAEMGLSPHNVVGIGDAENDHAFLRYCELSAAVANALPAVKDTADCVTAGDHGAGVAQLVELMINDDLAGQVGRLARHDLSFGKSGEREAALPAYGGTTLVCGPSGSGKSTVATRIAESIMEKGYQLCLIDPEGDYESFTEVMLGGAKGAPSIDEVVHALQQPTASLVVSLIGLPVAGRPPYFLEMLTSLLQLRAQVGRPHWLVLDEAHHLLPADWNPPEGVLPELLRNVLLITVHPDLLSPSILQRIENVIIVGADSRATLTAYCLAAGLEPPFVDEQELRDGEVLYWRRGQEVLRVQAERSQFDRKRHRRKYVEGDLPPDRSFYFRGPEEKLNLRAGNLNLFLELADGVDEVTWTHHRRRGDYSQWLHDCIKNDRLAEEVRRIEGDRSLDSEEARAAIREQIEREYVVMPTPNLPVPNAG